MLSFGVYEKNTKTNKEHFLESVSAPNITVARKLFIEQYTWKPRENVKLILKNPVGI